MELLNQAVTRDPAFVSALCRLASAHLYLYWVNADHTTTRLDLARKALEAAARLQPDAGEVHLTRALFYYWIKGLRSCTRRTRFGKPGPA